MEELRCPMCSELIHGRKECAFCGIKLKISNPKKVKFENLKKITLVLE